jgi:hypothetical protein
MATFYRSPGVLVTTDVFQRGWPDPEQFRIRDLRRVRAMTARPRHATVNAVTGAGVVLVAGATGVPLVEGKQIWLAVAALLAAGPTVMCGACMRRRQQVWELRAVYHGAPVLLLRTPDERMFGQVKRALVRALEANRG